MRPMIVVAAFEGIGARARALVGGETGVAQIGTARSLAHFACFRNYT